MLENMDVRKIAYRYEYGKDGLVITLKLMSSYREILSSLHYKKFASWFGYNV